MIKSKKRKAARLHRDERQNRDVVSNSADHDKEHRPEAKKEATVTRKQPSKLSRSKRRREQKRRKSSLLLDHELSKLADCYTADAVMKRLDGENQNQDDEQNDISFTHSDSDGSEKGNNSDIETIYVDLSPSACRLLEDYKYNWISESVHSCDQRSMTESVQKVVYQPETARVIEDNFETIVLDGLEVSCDDYESLDSGYAEVTVNISGFSQPEDTIEHISETSVELDDEFLAEAAAYMDTSESRSPNKNLNTQKEEKQVYLNGTVIQGIDITSNSSTEEVTIELSDVNPNYEMPERSKKTFTELNGSGGIDYGEEIAIGSNDCDEYQSMDIEWDASDYGEDTRQETDNVIDVDLNGFEEQTIELSLELANIDDLDNYKHGREDDLESRWTISDGSGTLYYWSALYPFSPFHDEAIEISIRDIYELNYKKLKSYQLFTNYFWKNHPIKVVCLTGLCISKKIAMDESILYELEDGSGRSIICRHMSTGEDLHFESQILRVWGEINVYRSVRQISVNRIKLVEDKADEILGLERIMSFRKRLNIPWTISKEVFSRIYNRIQSLSVVQDQ
ncbi:hypothetical protein V1511DRAFT_339950 [Dipodascopsis uninucleata]